MDEQRRTENHPERRRSSERNSQEVRPRDAGWKTGRRWM